MKKNLDIPQKHKQRLYPVVLELLSQNDFHQVNIRTICKKSGLSLGTIYKYFSSKEEILFRIIEEHIRNILELQRLHIQGLQSSKEIFRKLLWVTLDYYDKNTNVAVAAFITVPTRTWMQQDNYKLGHEPFDIFLTEAHQRGDIHPDIDIRRLQDIFYMICYRIIHSWYYFGRKWKLVEAMNQDFDIFWRMLSPEPLTS